MTLLPVPFAMVEEELVAKMSHLADLHAARHAFTRALESWESDDAPLFVDAGVIAFGRCMTFSNRRPLLSAFAPIPEARARTATWLKDHRHNATAHSGADTTQTRVFASTDDEVRVRIAPMTYSARVPRRFVEEALVLVQELELTLNDQIKTDCLRLESNATWDDIVTGQSDEPAAIWSDRPEDWQFGTPRARGGNALRINLEWSDAPEVDG